MNRKWLHYAASSASKANLVLIALIFLGFTLGCLGPSAADSQCEGVLKSGNNTYIGKAKDQAQAGLNACNKYCVDEDDESKAMIKIWLDSDAAKEFERKFKKKPTKEDAVIEDKTILDHVTKNCAVRCKAAANSGKSTLETSCK